MARFHGTNSRVTVNAVDLSSFIANATVNYPIDTHDVSALGDTGHTYITGLSDGTFDFDGHYDDDAAGPRVTLEPLLQAAAFTTLWHPEGTGSGLPQDSFSGVLANYNESTAVDNKISFSGSIQISGAVTTTNQA